MAAKLWTGHRSRVEYLRRLSIVFAVELRLRIVTELYMREMSPTQFHEEFGGGSVSRVTRNFLTLAEHGWLRHIRSEGPGGARRGAVEHFYRATELAIFDDETWALLPFSLRTGFSWRTLKQLAERWREALEAGTFDARPERHRTCTALSLDKEGWKRVNAAVDALFVSSFEEQTDARLRIFRSGERPLAATIALLAFESPRGGHDDAGSGLVEVRKDSPVPFSVRFSKVLADEMCMQIVAEANRREISAACFCREFGVRFDSAAVSGVSRRFKMLAEIGWLKLVGQKSGGRRRGATEYFYRAAAPALLDDELWRVPDSVGKTSSWAVFERLSGLAKEAMAAGTFDAHLNRYAAWSLLRLDQQGWEQVAAATEELLGLVLTEKKRAEIRMKESGEKPIATTVGLAAFESPATAVKEP